MNKFEQGMRAAGKLAAKTLRHVGSFVKPGITTLELDKITHNFIIDHGATPSPLGYKGYPKSICTSVNNVLCHGVPDENPLREGDIVNIDVTVTLNGYFGDTSATFPVGKTSARADMIISVAREAMWAGISAVANNRFTGNIGFFSARMAVQNGMVTAPGIGGHGIGRKFHLPPHIPGQGDVATGSLLRTGMCITVEPIIMEKACNIEADLIPGTNIHRFKATEDVLSAQFEHTVLITEKGCDILTISE
jgi:methionyl aminopeptidase